MPWKLDEDGKFVVDENKNPIFVLDSGEEKSVDYPAMAASLTRANKEAMERKGKIKEQEAILSALQGIDDIQAFVADARKNADAVKAMGEKEKDAESAARARVEAAVAPLQKQIAELERGKAEADERYHKAKIDAQFGTSKYVNTELVNPAMAKELFAKYFYVSSEGEIEAKDANGNIIYDESGKAGFETALRILVAASPYKDNVLKGSNSSGSGTSNSNGGGSRSGPRSLAECKTMAEKIAYLENEQNLK